MMRCHLCDQKKALRRSHVVPEFFYKNLYDQKHRFYDTLNGRLARTPPHQKGLRERLLCQDCEIQLSKVEGYAYTLLYRNTPVVLAGVDHFTLHTVDYTSIRLFGLSLLWRMSIATSVMWRNVQLGEHERTIKSMIRRHDPGTPHQFPFTCIAPLLGGQFYPDWVLQPDCVQADNGLTYRVVLGGYVFAFLVGSDYDEEDAPFFVQPHGTWTIPVVDAMEIEFLAHDLKKIEEGIHIDVLQQTNEA
jgi:hypothetical protein